MKPLIRLMAHGFLGVGTLAAGYALLSWIQAEAFQSYAKWTFDRAMRNVQSALPAPFDAAARPSSAPRQPAPELHSVLGRIEIPRLDLSTMVLEGAEERDLLLGAGHLPGTALPGEAGNMVLAGHRDTFFRPLRNIRKSDIITLTTLHGSHQYVVESTRIIGPSDVSVLQADPRPTLTLVTCYPFSYIGPAPERFVVQARKLL